MDMPRYTPIIVLLILSLLFTTKEAEGILGGNVAMPGWFRYQVSIQRDGRHTCGGSIIGDRFILTAAHCFVNLDNKRYEGAFSVVANEVDLDKLTSSTIRIDVERIYVPEDYRRDLAGRRQDRILTGDIAVLKLKANIGLDRNPLITKVELPKPDVTYQGVKAVVSGFGYDYIGDTQSAAQAVVTASHILLYTMANVMSNEKCQELYGPILISSQHLCGHVEQRAKDSGEGTCGGDSGGPLVHKNTIIGVLSTKPAGCAEDEMPGIYTRVSSYLEFIRTAMGDVDKSNKMSFVMVE